jgi:hypothetical protein
MSNKTTRTVKRICKWLFVGLSIGYLLMVGYVHFKNSAHSEYKYIQTERITNCRTQNLEVVDTVRVKAINLDNKCHSIYHVWHHTYEIDDYLALLAALGIVVAIYAAYKADQAFIKSEETFIKSEETFNKSEQTFQKSRQIEQTLLEIGLLTSEAKGEFKLIFKDQLIHNLQKLKNKQGEVYLAISTPAYGYGVLGQEGYAELYDAIDGLNGQECSIQIILFSPDAHFHYWSNLLLWSITKPDPLSFVLAYARNTVDTMTKLKDKQSQIWLMKETTVRFFAFSYHSEVIGQKVEKVFFSLVDRFSIYDSQFADGFGATSLPVIATQTHDYIEKKNSFFERLKQCPYSTNQFPALDFSDYSNLSQEERNEKVDKLGYLVNDYLLGRTHAHHLTPYRYFEKLFERFVNNYRDYVRKDDITIPEIQIVENALILICDYFGTTIESLHLHGIVTGTQLAYLQIVLVEAKKYSTKVSSDILNKVLTNYVASPNDVILQEKLIQYLNGLNENVDKLKYLLYRLVTSGFEQSEYVKKIN